MMDIDSALNELGMLSAVTDSQKDYKNEVAEKNSQASSSFHVLSANPRFVVSIGAVRHSPDTKDPHSRRIPVKSDKEAEPPSEASCSESLLNASSDRRTRKMSSRMHHRYFFRPYAKSRHPGHPGMVRNICHRSREGAGFHLLPPTESSLSQAMASMQIERASEGAVGGPTRLASVNVSQLPPGLQPRKGLRAHAR